MVQPSINESIQKEFLGPETSRAENTEEKEASAEGALLPPQNIQWVHIDEDEPYPEEIGSAVSNAVEPGLDTRSLESICGWISFKSRALMQQNMHSIRRITQLKKDLERIKCLEDFEFRKTLALPEAPLAYEERRNLDRLFSIQRFELEWVQRALREQKSKSETIVSIY